MKIFLDTNVIVSVLSREYPLFIHAAQFLSLVDNKQFQVYTSPLCLAIAFYFSEKKSGTKHAKEKIAILSGKLKIPPVNQETVRLSIADPWVNDFEDGLKYYLAFQFECKTIITGGISDFFFSEIPVLSCESFINSLT